MNNDERYLRAKKRVENLKGFYIHFTAYILVNAFIFAINFSTYDGEWWFLFTLGGWGIGLIIHGITVFASSRFGADWEERKIQKYMEQDKKD